MRLVFLGTGGYHPNERRHTACVLLPDLGIALDAGTGFFRTSSLLNSKTLDVFLSHAHLDHICGLTYFLVPVLKGQVDSVRIHGTAQTIAAVRTHLFSPELFPVEPPFEWHILPETQSCTPTGDVNVFWCPLEHPGGSIGFKLQTPGLTIAYITDTTAPGDYCEFVRGVDVLIHECYFPDEQHDWAIKTGHSSASCVARLAANAGAGRLILVHADPQNVSDDPVGLDGIRSIFPNTILAEDLMELIL
ncbi:MAG: metal-dependent hydrolase [Planctomyces sp.]|nr:metal-dependent hydrolase [Planctomyces sp.]